MTQWNLVWHSRDLRVEDHPPLTRASSGRVIPIFIHSPKEEGLWPAGEASNWWLHHSLQSLDEQYRALGTRLVVRSGDAEKIFQQLASEISISGVYWNVRYEPSTRLRDEQVKKQLEALEIPVYLFEGNYLITPSNVLSKTGQPYTVFTPFSKAVLAQHSWRKPLMTPKMKEGHPVETKSIESLGLLPKHKWANKLVNHWQPGRKGALDRLERFCEAVDLYEKKRNIPGIKSTSRLSPHLHFGEISPQEIWERVARSAKDPFPFLRQLIWREFGNYFIFHNPSVTSTSWKKEFENFPWKTSEKALEAWQKGKTGYPIVDAGMRELWHTGWMHNRVRMIVASFLVKDLLVHWIEGAKWFWNTLVDADLANNTLGWQWVAGCGPDAAPYFRIFNPVLQGEKFDPDGNYVRQWVPELADVPAKFIHCPWNANRQLTEAYPSPIVDHDKRRKEALEAYQKIK